MPTNKDKLKDISERLEQGIKDVFTSDNYKTYLKTMSKFHNYSYRNSLLIMMQNPDATRIAGYNAWKKNFKRQVNKGEKGIQILAPSPYRKKKEVDKIDPSSNKPVLDKSGNAVTETIEIQIPSFRPAYVFDVSQTSGEPLPKLTNELTGTVNEYEKLIESLKSISPFPIEFEDIKSGAKGYCDPVNERIAIKEGMSQIHTLKTAIHEITHADLHAPEKPLSFEDKTDRSTKEVEAESVAFIVSDYYGLDTSNYSFPYLASWSSSYELDELKHSLQRIQKQASELVDRIDKKFNELSIEPITNSFNFNHAGEYKEFIESHVQDSLYNGKLTQQEVGKINASMGEMSGRLTAYHLSSPNLSLSGYEEYVSNLVDEIVKKDSRTLYIYQMKSNDETLPLKFEGYDRLETLGVKPDISNYNMVYTRPINTDATLSNVYQTFNIDHPEDFRGHSLSISDVIVIEDIGDATAHYVDRIGFKEIPSFAKEHSKFDYLKFDNDIDIDRFKSREQLGFTEKKLSIKERLEQAKERSPKTANKAVPKREQGER